MSQPNPYQLLGVSLDATIDEIMSAFRNKVRDLGREISVTDPDYSRRRSVLYQAVSILTDPEQRKKLDASLESLEGPIGPADVKYIWQMAGKLFFERTERYTSAFEAMRNSIPLTIEDDKLLVIGMDPTQGNLLGYLNSSETRAALRRILAEICGRPMDYRVVTAVSLKEWQIMRDAEAMNGAARRPNGFSKPAPREEPSRLLSGIAQPAPAPAPAPAPTPVATVSAPVVTASAPITTTNGGDEWEEVMDRLLRLWSATESRSFPQVRARLILDSLALVARAEETARGRRMADDLLQRALGRALDRVGSLTGTDSALIGIEYLRIRGERVNGGKP